MFLAAAIDLGVPVEALSRPLESLEVRGWRLAHQKMQRHGITGTHVDVVLDEQAGHAHRALTEIRELISCSQLSSGAKERAISVFQALGEVEAKIHGVPLDEV